MAKRLLVLGAGFAGSTVAHLLKDRFETTVLEAAAEPGGGCRTAWYGGHPYTFGPRVFFSRDEAVIATLVTLTAPADAIVLEVAQRSVGSVAREAEPLITLVPVTAPLEAEVMIEPRDIAYLRNGDSVRVKLEALPFQRHGVMDGTLKVVSPDTVATQPGRDTENAQQRTPVYRGYITLGTPTFRAAPPDFRLLPGMTVVAEISIGRRSVLTYLFWPLVKVWDESLREP